jgi:hypothetical protein
MGTEGNADKIEAAEDDDEEAEDEENNSNLDPVLPTHIQQNHAHVP